MNKLTLKLIAAILAIVFTSTTICWSSPSPYKITVSEEIGKVRQRYKGSQNNKLIIHVQDAHTNFEAQKNLANIICELIPQIGPADSRQQTADSGTPFIGIEGAIGEYDLKELREFPIKEARERVGAEYVKDGKVIGAEYASMISDNDFTLYGIEDKDLFLKNFKAFYQIALRQSELEEEIEKIEGYLDLLKDALYNETLKEFDTQASAYERNQTDLMSYLSILYAQIDKHQIDLIDYVSLCQFKEILLLQSTIDFDAARKEIETLAEDLANRLDETSKKSLHEYYAQYTNQTIDEKTIIAYLLSLATTHSISLTQYSHLSRLQMYWHKYAMTDVNQLMRDILNVNNEIRTCLTTNSDEQLLAQTEDIVVRLRQILALKSVKDGVEHFRKNRALYSIDSIYSSIKKLISHANVNIDIDMAPVDINTVLNYVDAFYLAADERDQTMLNNVLEKMNATGQETGVLVAGGYHSGGITQLLKDQDISFVTITPQINSMVEDVAYLDRMMGNIAPLNPVFTSPFQASRFNTTIGLAAGIPAAKKIFEQARIDIIDEGGLILVTDSETGSSISPEEFTRRMNELRTSRQNKSGGAAYDSWAEALNDLVKEGFFKKENFAAQLQQARNDGTLHKKLRQHLGQVRKAQQEVKEFAQDADEMLVKLFNLATQEPLAYQTHIENALVQTGITGSKRRESLIDIFLDSNLNYSEKEFLDRINQINRDVFEYYQSLNGFKTLSETFKYFILSELLRNKEFNIRTITALDRKDEWYDYRGYLLNKINTAINFEKVSYSFIGDDGEEYRVQMGIAPGHANVARQNSAVKIADYLVLQKNLIDDELRNQVPTVMNMMFDHIFDFAFYGGHTFRGITSAELEAKREQYLSAGLAEKRELLLDMIRSNEAKKRAEGDMSAGAIPAFLHFTVTGEWPGRDPRLTLVVTKEQADQFRIIAEEMFLGPEWWDTGVPLTVDHIINFVITDSDEPQQLQDNVSISVTRDKTGEVESCRIEHETDDGSIVQRDLYLEDVREHTFGLKDFTGKDWDETPVDLTKLQPGGMIAIPLGTNSFGPGWNTSLFIAYRDADGKLTRILIDPHADYEYVMEQRGLEVRADYIVLTHNHPDHTEGLLSGTLKGIPLIASDVVRKGFERVLGACQKLTGQEFDQFIQWIDKDEVEGNGDGNVQSYQEFVHGNAETLFTLPGNVTIRLRGYDHSIPTVAVRVETPFQTIVHASDIQRAEQDDGIMDFLFRTKDGFVDFLTLNSKLDDPVHQVHDPLITRCEKEGIPFSAITRSIHYRNPEGVRNRVPGLEPLEVGEIVPVGANTVYEDVDGSMLAVESPVLEELLASADLRDVFTEQDRAVLSSIQTSNAIHACAAGDNIVMTDKMLQKYPDHAKKLLPDAVYFIRSGSYAIADDDGNIFAVIGPGEIFGESVWVNERGQVKVPRNANIIALTDGELVQIPSSSLSDSAKNIFVNAWWNRRAIKQCELFKNLPDYAITLIAALAQSDDTGRFSLNSEAVDELSDALGPKGDRVQVAKAIKKHSALKQGDAADDLFIIEGDGVLEVYDTTSILNRDLARHIGTLEGLGTFFGEGALFDNQTRNAYVVVNPNRPFSYVLRLSGNDIQQLSERYPIVKRILQKTVQTREQNRIIINNAGVFRSAAFENANGKMIFNLRRNLLGIYDGKETFISQRGCIINTRGSISRVMQYSSLTENETLNALENQDSNIPVFFSILHDKDQMFISIHPQTLAELQAAGRNDLIEILKASLEAMYEQNNIAYDFDAVQEMIAGLSDQDDTTAHEMQRTTAERPREGRVITYVEPPAESFSDADDRGGMIPLFTWFFERLVGLTYKPFRSVVQSFTESFIFSFLIPTILNMAGVDFETAYVISSLVFSLAHFIDKNPIRNFKKNAVNAVYAIIVSSLAYYSFNSYSAQEMLGYLLLNHFGLHLFATYVDEKIQFHKKIKPIEENLRTQIEYSSSDGLLSLNDVLGADKEQAAITLAVKIQMLQDMGRALKRLHFTPYRTPDGKTVYCSHNNVSADSFVFDERLGVVGTTNVAFAENYKGDEVSRKAEDLYKTLLFSCDIFNAYNPEYEPEQNYEFVIKSMLNAYLVTEDTFDPAVERQPASDFAILRKLKDMAEERLSLTSDGRMIRQIIANYVEAHAPPSYTLRVQEFLERSGEQMKDLYGTMFEDNNIAPQVAAKLILAYITKQPDNEFWYRDIDEMPDNFGDGKLIVYTCHTGFIAHTGRAVMVAKELRKLGAEVVFLIDNNRKFASHVTSGEHPFEVFHSASEASEEDIMIKAQQQGSWGFYSRKMIETEADNQKAALLSIEEEKGRKPDVIVSDFSPVMSITAEEMDLPLISMLNATWTNHSVRKLSPPETNFVTKLFHAVKLGWLARFLSDKIWATNIFYFIFLMTWRYHYNSVRRARGLRTVFNYYDQMAGEGLILMPDYAGLKGMRIGKSYVGSEALPVGPLIWEPSEEDILGKVKDPGTLREFEEFLDMASPFPLIYVTMGSSGTRDLFMKILLALNEKPYEVVITTGSQFDIEEFKSEYAKNTGRNWPSRFFMLPMYPGGKILEKAALTINHGGSGSVYQAIRAGVPQIMLPTHGDQQWNGDMMEEEGIGKSLLLRGLTVEKISETVDEMMTEVKTNPEIPDHSVDVVDISSQDDTASSAARGISAVDEELTADEVDMVFDTYNPQVAEEALLNETDSQILMDALDQQDIAGVDSIELLIIENNDNYVDVNGKKTYGVRRMKPGVPGVLQVAITHQQWNALVATPDVALSLLMHEVLDGALTADGRRIGHAEAWQRVRTSGNERIKDGMMIFVKSMIDDLFLLNDVDALSMLAEEYEQAIESLDSRIALGEWNTEFEGRIYKYLQFAIKNPEDMQQVISIRQHAREGNDSAAVQGMSEYVYENILGTNAEFYRGYVLLQEMLNAWLRGEDINVEHMSALLERLVEVFRQEAQEIDYLFNDYAIYSDVFEEFTHWLRTPMTALRGYFDLLTSGKELTETQKNIFKERVREGIQSFAIADVVFERFAIAELNIALPSRTTPQGRSLFTTILSTFGFIEYLLVEGEPMDAVLDALAEVSGLFDFRNGKYATQLDIDTLKTVDSVFEQTQKIIQAISAIILTETSNVSGNELISLSNKLAEYSMRVTVAKRKMQRNPVWGMSQDRTREADLYDIETESASASMSSASVLARFNTVSQESAIMNADALRSVIPVIRNLLEERDRATANNEPVEDINLLIDDETIAPEHRSIIAEFAQGLGVSVKTIGESLSPDAIILFVGMEGHEEQVPEGVHAYVLLEANNPDLLTVQVAKFPAILMGLIHVAKFEDGNTFLDVNALFNNDTIAEFLKNHGEAGDNLLQQVNEVILSKAVKIAA